MCGIAGFLSPGVQIDRDASAGVLARMTASLVHRGPDAAGQWLDEHAGVALGHRRLSVIDLSPAGAQPMVSLDGSTVLTFNGEIYNFQQLRDSLESRFGVIPWRGTSDTEVLLEAIARLGLEKALREAVGMFGLATWNRNTRTLELARDRLGEKPLYYAQVANQIVFASEVRAFRAIPSFEARINRDSIAAFLRHNYIPSPQSIYHGVNKLPPGTLIRFHGLGERPTPSPYWSLRKVVAAGLSSPFNGSAREAADELDRLLRNAIRGQMISDVPLGAFLSGGVDSSMVVALMQAQSARPVKTFSIGFHEPEFNEAQYAKAVASHLGTEHHELYVTPRDAMEMIPDLGRIYDEPFSDSSEIPTTLISQLARRSVTVSLSGDGGDELFGGYHRYQHSSRVWNALRAVPWTLRATTAKVLATWPGERGFVGHLSEAAPLIRSTKLGELYRGLVSHSRKPERLVIGGTEQSSAFMDEDFDDAKMSDVEWMMFIDAVTYLPDDVLVKVDRAAMSVALETRVPLLDHRIVEFAWALPFGMRVRSGAAKALLRDVLYRYVPAPLIDRRKKGFNVPIGTWMRGPLRDWVEILISRDRLHSEGYLRPEPIRAMWQEHLSGRRSRHTMIWNVLMFQSWLEHNDRSIVSSESDV